MRILPWMTLGLACVCLAACEPVPHYNRLQVATMGAGPHRAYGSVKLYQNAGDVKRPYEMIALMSCEGSTGEEAGIVNAMLYRAADLGADGVVLGGAKLGAEQLDKADQRVDVRLGWATMIGNGDHVAYRAQAIRFK